MENLKKLFLGKTKLLSEGRLPANKNIVKKKKIAETTGLVFKESDI